MKWFEGHGGGLVIVVAMVVVVLIVVVAMVAMVAVLGDHGSVTAWVNFHQSRRRYYY